MREPQATSTLGTCCVSAFTRLTRALCTSLVACALIMPTVASAQIRNRSVSANYGWWISGGASGVVLNDITDGVSQSKWTFGGDPLLQYRASIEKGIDEFTTIGVVAGYGKVAVSVQSIAAALNAKLPSSCQTSCPATTEMWTALAQFRTGGGEGFHTLFEIDGGVTSFRRFITTSDQIALTGITNSLDLTGTLGPGFGYALSRSFVVTLVQDFGIGFHSKTDLPSGTGRTWHVRTTRASLRIKF